MTWPPRIPATGLSRWGTVAASHDNARKAFDKGAPVLVYPGGDYETFRPSWHSDRVEFGGRKGFIKLALEREVPIVPVVAIGGQETALFLTRGERAARLDRLGEPDPHQGAARRARASVRRERARPADAHPACRRRSRSRCCRRSTSLERFGPDPEYERVYEEITGEMQEALSELQEERTLPVVG